MRLLVLSDVHANIDALERVLSTAAGSWDRVVVLGDLVGYGADPNGVIDTSIPPPAYGCGARVAARAARRHAVASNEPKSPGSVPGVMSRSGA